MISFSSFSVVIPKMGENALLWALLTNTNGVEFHHFIMWTLIAHMGRRYLNALLPEISWLIYYKIYLSAIVMLLVMYYFSTRCCLSNKTTPELIITECATNMTHCGKFVGHCTSLSLSAPSHW